MSDQQRVYKAHYRVWPAEPGMTLEKAKKLLEEEDVGSCDAVILASIIYPEDGGLSVKILTADGRQPAEEKKAAPLADIEMFKVWALMAHRLSESKTLDDGRRGFAAAVFDEIKIAVMSGRDDLEEEPDDEPEELPEEDPDDAYGGEEVSQFEEEDAPLEEEED